MIYNPFRSLITLAAAAGITSLSGIALAADEKAVDEKARNEAVAEALKARMPAFDDVDVQPSAIDNVFEVSVGGTAVYYMSEDARYVIQGDMIDLESRINLTESRRSGARRELLADLDDSATIMFSPAAGEVEHTITVFTDIDCGYCRKLHQEVAQLNDLGIAVRYAFYPRSGPQSPSWAKAEAVACASDRNAALTLAKAGNEVKSEACETEIVDLGWNVGRSVGVSGTPAIVTESGYLIAGYLPAPKLKQQLEQIAAN
jgi:thiol:disulfide interchange protein DsbC